MNPSPTDRSGLLAAGNWIVDHVKVVDTYPEQDALAFIGGQRSSNGGGPYNVLKDLAKLGAAFPLAGAGLVGDDPDGRWILEDCAAAGIDTSRLRATGAAPTSYTDVMSVASTGRRTFFHQVGANALLDEKDIQFDGCGARFFYLGYLLLLEALDRRDSAGGTGAARLLKRARGAGLETVVDLVSAQEGDFAAVVQPALPETDTLFLNEREAGALLGRDLAGAGAEVLDGAAGEVLAMGVRERVVLHCAEGAVWVAADGARTRWGSVALPAEAIRGATGAGDAFAAGVLFGLHEGESPEGCLRWGVCAAAGCLGDPTTSEGVRPLAESLEFGARFGFREF